MSRKYRYAPESTYGQLERLGLGIDIVSFNKLTCWHTQRLEILGERVYTRVAENEPTNGNSKPSSALV